jgi:hypothetical protein
MVAAEADNSVCTVIQVNGSGFDLADCLIDFERVAAHISGIGDLDGLERLGFVGGMKIEAEMPGCLAYGLGSEAGTGAVTGTGVERNSENCDVTIGDIA